MSNQIGGKQYFYTPTGFDQNNNYQNTINTSIVLQNSSIKKSNSQQQQQQQQQPQLLYNQFTTPNSSQVRTNGLGNDFGIQQNNNKDDYYQQGNSYQQSISDNRSKINTKNGQNNQMNQNNKNINNNTTTNTSITPFPVDNNAQQQQQYQSGIGQKQTITNNNMSQIRTPDKQPRDKSDNNSQSIPSNPKHESTLLAEDDGDDEQNILAPDGTHNIYENFFNKQTLSKPAPQKKTIKQEQSIKNEDPKQKYTLYKKPDYSNNQEDVLSGEGDEAPNSPISAILSPLKSKRFLSGIQGIVPKSNVFQANNINRKDQGEGQIILNDGDSEDEQSKNKGNYSKIQDDDNNNILQLSLNNSSINDTNIQNRQSLFRYDPALYQSVAGYFIPSQGAKNAFNVESILNDINECYENDQTKCSWLKNIVEQYFQQNNREYFQRINREISGLQGAENLGDYFMRKYSSNREKRVAGCSHAQRYPVYLGVRGDGNCFYRALIVSYIASILGNSERVGELEVLILEIQSNKVNLIELWYQGVSRDDSDLARQILIQQLVLLLLQMKKSQDLTEVSVLLMSFFENVARDHDFDYSLVLLCRSMLLTAIDVYSSQSPYNEYILPDEADRTRDKIRTYKEDAEYHVISLSTEIFKVSIQIISLQKDKLGHFEFFEGLSYSPQIANLNTQATNVTLLLADGHYDLLFDRRTCLTYFPSLALFNKHNLYKEDLVFLTEDTITPLEIKTACSQRLIEYEKFLKDQEDQLIKTKQSQANLQSLYQSKIRNTFTPVNNAQGFTMSHFPRQESLPIPELMYNQLSLDSTAGANGILLSKQESNALMSQPINHLNNDQNNNMSAQNEINNEIIEINTEGTSTIVESNKFNEDHNINIENNNVDQKTATPNPKNDPPGIPTITNTNVSAQSSNFVNPFEEQKQSSQSISSKPQNHQMSTGQTESLPQRSQSNLIPQSSLISGISSFYNVESDRTTLSKQQKITPMGDKLDQGTKKSLKKAEQQKSQVPVCNHAREAQITVSSVTCCKLSFEICYTCFKTRQITLCPSCRKDLLSINRINSTTKNCKLSCKNCEKSGNNIVPLFNQVYCVICDLPKGWK